MDIANLLQSPVGQQMIGGVVNQLGINNQQAQLAVSAGIPLLLSALNKNAAGGDAQNIANALERDHNGSILDNITGYLSGGNFSDGLGILNHVLGGKQSQVEGAIGKASGLNSGQIAQVLAMIAPIVMGYLGKQKSDNGLDASGVTSLLGNLVGGVSQSNEREMSMIEKLLDQDGDGSALDDAMDIGSKLLGGLFGRK